MKPTFTKARTLHGQHGYALLMIMFAVAIMLVMVSAVTPNVLTEGKREKEEEMIWRGKQYVRGIKRYYRKLGRFPTNLDDLTKPKTGTLRFMRKAYKDPMNKDDGSWRLIYVGPAGQLIGSLKPAQTINFGAAGGAQPGQPGTPASTLAAARGALNLSGLNQAPDQQGAQQGTGTLGATTSAGQNSAPGQAQGDTSDASATGAQAEPVTILGGNIIGVGSKISSPSVIVYDKAKNYHLFEFIWDPSKDVVTVGQPGQQIGAPAGTVTPGQNPAQGQSPFGIQPSQNPLNPPGQPPLANPPSQNPTPNPQ